jgi:hypothetical protein
MLTARRVTAPIVGEDEERWIRRSHEVTELSISDRHLEGG